MSVLEQFTHPTYPRLVLLKRPNSPYYHSRTYLDGKLLQKSLKTKELTISLKLSEEWYKKQLRLSDQKKKQHPIEKVTRSTLLGEIFPLYRETLSEKQEAEAKKRWSPIAGFWRGLSLHDVSAQTFMDFYRWRKGVKPHTLHKDICVVRQVLKFATVKHSDFTIPHIPKHPRIESNPRPWLTADEWEKLCKIAVKRMNAKENNRRTRQQRVDTYEFARFMVASMCRVDELRTLHFNQCKVETVGKRQILRCEFKGKTGMRVAFASAEAVSIYERRVGEDLTALVFPSHHRDAFRELLKDAKLYTDTFGNRRNYKALRATSISLAILRPNPPTLFQIARNAGTSVGVIENYYAKRLTAESGKDILTAAEPLSW